MLSVGAATIPRRVIECDSLLRELEGYLGGKVGVPDTGIRNRLYGALQMGQEWP